MYNCTMKLTLAIATYNEEKNIHYALDSTIEWVDEVVVVDGGSTDKTIEILRAYGSKVKIIEADNPPMFHINKQKAIDAASGDWILQLDADEEITPELRAEIEKVSGVRYQVSEEDHVKEVDKNSVSCRLSTDNYFAYQIPRKNFFLGRPLMKGGVYPDYTIRLYKKGTMYFPCKDVHENVAPIDSKILNPKSQILYKSQAQNQQEISPPSTESRSRDDDMGGEDSWLGTLQNPMNHYSDPSFARYLARWQRYTSAEAKRVVAEAKKVYGNDSGKLVQWKMIFLIKAFLFLPILWFLKTYIRHKGFMDGWQGLVFHFMSAVRWWGIGTKVLNARF